MSASEILKLTTSDEQLAAVVSTTGNIKCPATCNGSTAENMLNTTFPVKRRLGGLIVACKEVGKLAIFFISSEATSHAFSLTAVMNFTLHIRSGPPPHCMASSTLASGGQHSVLNASIKDWRASANNTDFLPQQSQPARQYGSNLLHYSKLLFAAPLGASASAFTVTIGFRTYCCVSEFTMVRKSRSPSSTGFT